MRHLLFFSIIAMTFSACFPYNWHEQELRKADDATQACKEELENVRDNLAVCQGKMTIDEAASVARGRAELARVQSVDRDPEVVKFLCLSAIMCWGNESDDTCRDLESRCQGRK